MSGTTVEPPKSAPSEQDCVTRTAEGVRPIRFIECSVAAPGWLLKWYGINANPARNLPSTIVDSELMLAAKGIARELFSSELANGVHNVGFGIIHQGTLGNWLLINWWAQGILLYHRLYHAGFKNPATFTPRTDALLACIWELPVFGFERDAWVRSIRERRDERGSQIERYLEARFDDDV